VAVFVDGSNEIIASYQTGRAGSVLDAALLARRFDSDRRGLGSDLLSLGRHSALVRRLAEIVAAHRTDRRPGPASDLLCRDVAVSYGNTVRTVRGLGQESGFETVFLWQPMFATTHKPLSPWEQSLRSPWPGYRELAERCSTTVDSLMQERHERAFSDMADLFDGNPASVYLDDVGHVTEAGNADIAARIADAIVPILEKQPASAPPRRRS
jgi:hypothetical protein